MTVSGPVGGWRDAATVAALLRRALRDDYLRRLALVLATTSVGAAAAVLVHLLVVDGTRALPASVLAALLTGVLFGVPVGACLLLAVEVVGAVVELVPLALAHWRQLRLTTPAQRVPETGAERLPGSEEPEEASATSGAGSGVAVGYEPPACAFQPAPDETTPCTKPASTVPEARWVEQWRRALEEPLARPVDVDPTVRRAHAGAVLEVQDADADGRLSVRRMRAISRPTRGAGVGDVGVWACTESAWQLFVVTGQCVPAERLAAELVVTVEEAAGAGTSERGS